MCGHVVAGHAVKNKSSYEEVLKLVDARTASTSAHSDVSWVGSYGVNAGGADIRTTKGCPQACYEACKKEPECRYWMVHLASRLCWLKGAGVGLYPQSGFVSGG